MVPDGAKTSQVERRWSQRQSGRLSIEVANGVEDVAPSRSSFSGTRVADGFRPQSRERTTRPVSIHREGDISQLSDTLSRRRSTNLEHRSSIAKPSPGRRAPTSVNQGMPVKETNDAPVSRMSTVSADMPISSNRDSYVGPSGPSHPYQMYQQNVRLGRTLSSTTASTTPRLTSASPYTGPTAPSHAYTAYSEPAVLGHGSAVTGPGNYQRRLGPDGEEAADLIGPDGHTEALPPYTQYPDEAYVKEIRDHAAMPVPGATSAPLSSHPLHVMAIPGAGGIGLAARNPEFDSPDDERPGMPSSRSHRSLDASESHHEVNTAARYSEKPVLNKWQKLGRRRIWGIVPCWAIGLAVATILIAVIIVSAVVKTLMSRRNNHSDAGNFSSPTVTLTVDAVPVATTTAGSVPLPTGTFGLSGLGSATQAPNMCFNDTTQAQAWSCNVVTGYAVRLGLTANTLSVDGFPSYDLTLAVNQSYITSSSLLIYGSQPPVIDQPVHLDLVTDTFDPSRGQAWFGTVSHNKTVLVAENYFNYTSVDGMKNKRVGSAGGTDWRIAMPGDKPWICTWPDTFVEIFIYESQNNSYASSQPSTTTTTTDIPTITATSTSDTLYSAYRGTTTTARSQSNAVTTSATTAAAQATQFSLPPIYPRVIKIKERRFNNPTEQPYCSQVEVQADNSTRPVLGADHKPVVVYIPENEPGPRVDVHTRKRNVALVLGSVDEEYEVEAELDETGVSGDIALGKRHPMSRHWQSDDQSGFPSMDMSNCGCMWFIS